jgi:nucleoside-diphosphate kinase
MAIERTLSIIKPDATRNNHIGKIIARFEEEGLRIAGCRKAHLSRREAEGFYAVHAAPLLRRAVRLHEQRPLRGHRARGRGRHPQEPRHHGRHQPRQAAPGTLRKLYAASIGENAVHGSDSAENAAIEIAYFFRATELF